MKIEKLRKIGLSDYEAKCYLSLLQFGNLQGKEIAKKAAIPPTSVYRNLETLKEKGFVSLIQKEPMIFQAVKPDVAVKSVIKREKESLDILEKESVKELKQLKKGRIIEKREEILEIYTGRKQSFQITKDLIDKSQKEFLIIAKGAKLSILDIIHNLKSASKRNVEVKFIITKYKESNPMIPVLKKIGIKIRYYPLEGFALLVKDRDETQMVIKMPKKEERIVLKITNPALAKVHADYFDSVWKKAELL